MSDRGSLEMLGGDSFLRLFYPFLNFAFADSGYAREKPCDALVESP
jgi:hypothetical protein